MKLPLPSPLISVSIASKSSAFAIAAPICLRTTVKYSGTDPVIGYNKLAADGNGCVKVSDNGRLILVTDVDKVNKEIDIIL